MDFILNEAEIDELKFEFSDSESEMECECSPSSEDECFINDASSDEDEREENGSSFYRPFDKREEFKQFKNHFKNPVEASERSENEFYGEDDLSEMFVLEKKGKM